MRKDIVIELSYKGFSWSGDNSWSHYNPCRSQILTPQRYLFVTMPENATNGYEWRNKTLRNSELFITHAKNLVTEKDCVVPPRFAYRHRTLRQLILKSKKLRTMKSTFSVIYYLKRQVVKKDGTVPVMGRITVDGSQTQFSCKLTVDPDRKSVV